jgi:uncharacterized Zn-binding protein involved in type VI secretion
MPAVTRLGDQCSGHGCFPPRPNVQASNNVFVNGLGVHREDDGWASHCCGIPCHSSILEAGSSKVYVNGKQMCRIGDPVECGSIVAQGSGNVFAGG